MSLRRRLLLSVAATACCLPALAVAAVINFTASALGGSSWRYDYSVTSDSLGSPIQEFTIYFAPNLYSGLSLVSSPAGWDPLVIQPDTSIPADGYFDALAAAGGLAQGDTVGGFSVSFNYLGSGTPGAQSFDVVDPDTFEVLQSGRTSQNAGGAGVPIGSPTYLMMAALIGLMLIRSRSTVGI